MMKIYRRVNKNKLLLFELLIILIIIFAGVKFTHNLGNNLDIDLFDESGYLYRGATIPEHGLPDADDGPLYSTWYYILSLFESDRTDLYFLNYKLLIIILPVVIYGILRSKKVPIPISTLVSWFFLISRLNARSWPKVSHLASILILLALIPIDEKQKLKTLGYPALGALAAAFIRPEFFLSYLILLAAYLMSFIWRRSDLREWIKAGVILFSSAVLFLIFGFPVSGGRTYHAFGQHFAVNWVKWTGDPRSPWTNWASIIQTQFSDTDNIWGIIRSEPNLFIKHLFENTATLITQTYSLLFPDGFTRDKFSVLLLLTAFVAASFLHRQTIKENLKKHRYLLLAAGIFLLPSLISTIVIYPRNHYILLLVTQLICLLTILLTSGKIWCKKLNFRQIILVGLILIGITPYYFTPGRSDLPQRELTTIRFIQSLDIEQPVYLLEAQGGITYYLDPNYHRVSAFEKDSNFLPFLKDNDINMILITDSLRQDSRFIEDEEWNNFLESHGEYGFASLNIPAVDRTLLIEDRLSPR
jgi:hypothetical protein